MKYATLKIIRTAILSFSLYACKSEPLRVIDAGTTQKHAGMGDVRHAESKSRPKNGMGDLKIIESKQD